MRLKPATLLLIAWCVLAVPVFAAAGLVWWVWPARAVPGVEAELTRAVPVGAGRADVEAYLGGRGIAPQYSRDLGRGSPVRVCEIDLAPYSAYIGPLYFEPDRSLYDPGFVRVFILFDAEDRVARRVVEWTGHGP